MITVTEAAKKKFREAIEAEGRQGHGLRVSVNNAGIPRPSGPVAEAVQTVLQEKINPAIAAHGGQVSLVAVKDATGTNPYYQPSK